MSVFRRIPLTLKMTLVTLLVGIAAWSLLDPLHRRAMKDSFGRQLNERLQQDSHENRMLFDDYINRYSQSTKILISQRSFQDYANAHAEEWTAGPAGKRRIIYHSEPPVWMPVSSVIRSLPHMHYVFLLDKGKSIREVYLKQPEPPPGELLEPAALLLLMSHQQAFMTSVDNKPYLIASETLRDKEGNETATLMLADPLDDEFIRESQGAIYSKKLVALVSMDPPVIIESSHPETLAPGTKIEDIQGIYLYAGKGFFDYGSSDLRMNFMTFLPTRPFEDLSESILKEERRNRLITALMLILSFSIVMYLVTKRVRNVMGKIGNFAEIKFNIKQPQVEDGDEIDALEQRLRTLSREVIASHGSIKEQARMLRQERDRAQNYLDTAASIFLVTGPDHKVVLINRRGCEILQYSEEELIGMDWFDTVIPAGGRENARGNFQQFITNKIGNNMYFESPVRTKNGEQRIIGWHNTLLKDEAGIIIGVLGSGEDVTDRRKAEEKLLQAHQMLETKVMERTAELEKSNILLKEEIQERITAERNLQIEKDKLHKYLDISAVMVIMIDRDQNVSLINKKGCEILGYKEEEIIGRNWFDNFLPEELTSPVKKVYVKLLAGEIEPVEYYENEVLTKDGEVKMIAWYNTVFRDDAGHITATLGTGIDITKQKKTEIALRISEERFRGAFESAAVGIALVSPEGRWLKVNSALCNMVGYSEQEMLALTFQDITHPEDLDADMEYVRKMLAGEIRNYQMEKRYFHKDGRIVWILLSVSLVRDENGPPLHFVSQIMDITQRKQAEMQVAASLKEKEVLLQEIHHRVKNNMTVISSLLKLQSDKVTDEHYKELFNESTNRIKTMALIHEKLYRSEDLARIVFSDYLRDMTDNIFGSYGISNRKVHLKRELDMITLALDTSIPCGLIVNELVSNSLKYAFPDGRNGVIRVSLKKNNGNVKLTVADDGIGLPADLDYRNTGSLGLNIVNALVKQIRGDIELHREQGTEFHITFRSDTE